MLIRGLKDSTEFEKLFSFYSKVFITTPLSYFIKRIINDSLLLPEDIKVIEENNEILSSVAVFKRKMYWEGKSILFGGIGNVSTHPNKRGLGLSSRLMNEAIKYMKENSLEISILFTGINSFYEKFSYFTIPSFYLNFQATGILEDTKYNIRDFNIGELEKVAKIYEIFNKNLFGPVKRDLNYWKANLEFAEENEIFLIAENDNEIFAYIRAVPGKNNEIWEFGYTEIEAFNALLFSLFKRFNKYELKTFAICPKYFMKESNNIRITYEKTDIAMALIFNKSSNMLKDKFNNYCFWWTDNY